MMRHTALWVLTALAVGCTAGPALTTLPPNHPANPEAAAAPLPGDTPSLTLADEPPPTLHRDPGHHEPHGVVYVCPMHPEVTSTDPADRCPRCGMALEPQTPDQDHSDHSNHQESEGP